MFFCTAYDIILTLFHVIQDLGFLPFQGTVKLKNPEHEFWLLEDYGTDPNNAPEKPFCIYFGRWVRFREIEY